MIYEFEIIITINIISLTTENKQTDGSRGKGGKSSPTTSITTTTAKATTATRIVELILFSSCCIMNGNGHDIVAVY